jgi:hypothetical protein
MSVINNVLKDIQARPSQFVPIEIASVESAVDDQVSFSKTPMIILVLVVLVAALAYWYFQYYQKPVVVASPPEVNLDTPAMIEPVARINQIVDLQISESVDEMSLEFSLQAKVISYLKERGESSFVYFLKDIRSEIVAPMISNNQWIEKLSISTLEKGVEVRFHTAPGVLVETRQQPVDGGQIWVIKLKKPSPQLVVAEVVEVPIKTIVEPKAVESSPVEPASSDVTANNETNIEVINKPKVVKLDIQSRTPELTDSEKLQKAIELQKSRRWQQASVMLKALIGGPEDLGARLTLLDLYDYRKRTVEFSALLQESLDRYPQQSKFQTAFARSLYQSGDYRVVIEFLQGRGNPDTIQLALIATSYQRLDQHTKAIEYYRLALDKDQRQAKNWIGMGISQEHTDQLKDALRSYRIGARLGNINARLQAFTDKRISQLVKVIN